MVEVFITQWNNIIKDYHGSPKAFESYDNSISINNDYRSEFLKKFSADAFQLSTNLYEDIKKSSNFDNTAVNIPDYEQNDQIASTLHEEKLIWSLMNKTKQINE